MVEVESGIAARDLLVYAAFGALEEHTKDNIIAQLYQIREKDTHFHTRQKYL